MPDTEDFLEELSKPAEAFKGKKSTRLNVFRS